MKPLRPLRRACVELDGQTRRFPAIVRKTWNGWAVPVVTPKVRAQIALHMQRIGIPDLAREVRDLPVKKGLVEINVGATFNRVACRRLTTSERKHAEETQRRAEAWLTRLRKPVAEG